MTKRDFIKCSLISSVITILAIAMIIGFCVAMFDRYSPPNDDNTSMISDTVTDVYYATGTKRIVIELSNVGPMSLEYPWFPKEVYNSIGYDLDQLSDLLEGKHIECRRMTKLPWAVEIYVDDIVIDNNKLTEEQIIVTRVSIIIIGLIMLAFPLVGEVMYLKPRYKRYKKTEKKLKRKLNRESRKSKSN